jgi:predicted peroxiredoxin
LEAVTALGGARLACELAVSLANLTPNQLDSGVEISGAVTFLTRAKDFETLFV